MIPRIRARGIDQQPTNTTIAAIANESHSAFAHTAPRARQPQPYVRYQSAAVAPIEDFVLVSTFLVLGGC